MSHRQALYLAVLSVLAALAATGFLLDVDRAPAAGVETPDQERGGDDVVRGLWSRWPDRRHEGDPIRFYYFHGDGHGLYRYGRVGFTNTHSFDYRVSDNALVVKFRKTGVEHRLPYQVELGRDGRRVLHLQHDPEENGVNTDYFFVPPPSTAFSTSPRPMLDAKDAATPAGRMWIDLQEFATGGMGFSMYQLAPAGIDGRGTGWHHRGDFDDWSTESLTYRLDETSLEVRFDLTGERFRTSYGVAVGEDKKRRLVLHEDGRNWWHRAVFTDMGRSFAADLSFLPEAFGAGAPEGD